MSLFKTFIEKVVYGFGFGGGMSVSFNIFSYDKNEKTKKDKK